MNITFFKSETANYLFKLALLAIVYGVVGYFSYYLVPRGAGGTFVVWPPAAIGVAALLLWGLDLWPAIFISFFTLFVWHGQIAPIATGAALANTLESFLAAYLLTHYFKFDSQMIRFRDVLSLVIASIVAALSSATVTAFVIHLVNGAPFNNLLWGNLAIGHTVSLFSLGAFFITWFNKKSFTYPKWKIAEKTAVLGTIATLDFVVFWTPFANVDSVPLLYVLLVLMVWAAVRLSMRGMSFAILSTTLIGATGVVFGYGPISQNPSQALLSLQIFIGIISIIFLTFSSITEERRAAVGSLQEYINRLESLLAQIRASDEAKNEFLAILAHELRNPLAPIVSSVEIMREEILPASENIKLINVIDTHVRTMARLLDDLLEISRISQKKFQLHPETVSLQSVVEITLQTVETYMSARRHTLTINLPNEPIFVEGDAVRLEQALVNLLNNAAKYTEPGGKIILSAEKKDSNAVISIIDTGIGIPDDMKKLIFEPFSSTSTMRRPGGLGVGLYLTKRLIEMHEGTIEVLSEGKNRGSQFILTIPLAQKNPESLMTIAEMLARKPLSSASKDSSKTILIVDDNEPAAQGLSTLLKHSGHTTQMAYTGASALLLSKEMKPNVVLLDIGLPDMEGYEVAKQMRDQRGGESFTLVALTGYGQEDDKKKAWDAGFDHHLTKPVGIADVQKILATT